MMDSNVRTIVTAGGTEGRNMCSDSPTSPPVIDACFAVMFMGRSLSFDPEARKTHQIEDILW